MYFEQCWHSHHLISLSLRRHAHGTWRSGYARLSLDKIHWHHEKILFNI